MKEEKEKTPLSLPQRSKLAFEGRKATQFWLRALNLEGEIEAAKRLILAKSQRKRGSVPIVAEYEVDERLKFVFFIVAEVDSLGIQGGGGIIYGASPEFVKEAYAARDKLAHEMLENLEKAGFDEVIELEEKREK